MQPIPSANPTLDAAPVDAEISTFVLLPSPILWMQELEGVNDQPGRLPVWRELALRSRQRGSQSLGGRDWSGSVYLPSGVLAFLMEKRRLRVPSRWASTMDLRDLTRFLAVLCAWQTDRLIYEFAGLAGEIVLNSQARMKLSPATFSLIPSHAIYIDFDSLNFRERHLPGGIFVGLNVDDLNRPELVIAIDRFDSIRVQALPLDGSTVDLALGKLLSDERRRGATPKELEAFCGFLDHHLQTILSAVMMVSASQGVLEHVEDGVSRIDGHGLWTRWSIQRAFTAALNTAYATTLAEPSASGPVVVGEWVEPSEGVLANLRCSVGTRSEWGRVPGLPAGLRGSVPDRG